MERWRVENFERTPQMSSKPADTGTTCHFALEHFVQAVYIDKTHSWDDVKFLKDLYNMGYTATFNSGNYDTPEYKDGADLIAKWYEYNKAGLSDTVLSCEVKDNFQIKTSAGEIPFNYIWDRADQIDETTYRVIDYKTLRAPVSAEDLKRKIQPRAYALAAAIKWQHAERIWITFDMLRYEPVGVVFTREDNIATWNYLKRAAERIIATKEDETEETLNPECKWCIKKATCDTLATANRNGNVMGLSLEEIARRHQQISDQVVALRYAQEELDKALCLEAENRDQFEFDEGDYEVKIGSRATRKANSSAIAHIVGPDLSLKYGNFTMTNIDKMMKNENLPPEMESAIKAEIVKSWSEPSAKVKKKADI
jgi:hypothetical protein